MSLNKAKTTGKQKLRVLALDPSTKMGFAHSCGGSGTWVFDIRRDESAGMRLIRLRGKLEEILKDAGIDLLVFEAARHAAPHMQGALLVQAELQSVIKVFCEDHKIQYRGYSPSEIKKQATGKGSSPKALVLAAAQARWPNVADDNQADALWLLELACSQLQVS